MVMVVGFSVVVRFTYRAAMWVVRFRVSEMVVGRFRDCSRHGGGAFQMMVVRMERIH
jgi:hypothetical protein